MINLGRMSLFLGEHHIITLNPSRPKRDAAKQVPCLDYLNTVLRDLFPQSELVSSWKLSQLSILTHKVRS